MDLINPGWLVLSEPSCATHSSAPPSISAGLSNGCPFSLVPSGAGRHVLKMKYVAKKMAMKTNILKATAAIKLASGFLALAAIQAFAQNDTKRFHALVLAERGDQHEEFVVVR